MAPLGKRKIPPAYHEREVSICVAAADRLEDVRRNDAFFDDSSAFYVMEADLLEEVRTGDTKLRHCDGLVASMPLG